MKTIKKERKKSNMSFNFCQCVDGNKVGEVGWILKIQQTTADNNTVDAQRHDFLEEEPIQRGENNKKLELSFGWPNKPSSG